MKQIVTIFEPTIKLDEVDTRDVEYGTDPDYKNPDGTEIKHSKLAGSVSPFVVINKMKFGYHQIKLLELDVTGFLPTITISISGKGGIFTSKSFPKDGDVISLYIRSETPDFKPVRQDYRILDVTAPPSTDPDGQNIHFSLVGILNIPAMFVDKIKSYANMTSMKTLQEIAKDLGLGFATNETTTNDSMTRVCPSIDYYDFIMNDVLSSAYLNDESFFTCYIDQYYYLNFIQVNDMLVHDTPMDTYRLNRIFQSDYNPDESESVPVERDVFLTNSKVVSDTPNFITGYTPVNNSGIVSMLNGYRTYLQYYDKKKAEFTQYFIETLNTPESEDKIILKGREDEDHREQMRAISFVNQMNDNVHTNYYHAKIQNKYNMEEITKLNLVCNLSGINPVLHRYGVVPILITVSSGSDITRIVNKTGKEEGEQSDMTFDRFLSGWYAIGGIRYIFSQTPTGSSPHFHVQLVCIRREYDIPFD